MTHSPRQVALDLLARREHTATELSRKLLAKNFDPDEIKTLIESLTQEGLLNSHRYIEHFIYYRRNKGYGPLRIQAELRERGIPEKLIEQQLNIADNAWFVEAQQVWKKRFKNVTPVDFKTRAQQMRFLQYRGFTFEQIESVFSE